MKLKLILSLVLSVLFFVNYLNAMLDKSSNYGSVKDDINFELVSYFPLANFSSTLPCTKTVLPLSKDKINSLCYLMKKQRTIINKSLTVDDIEIANKLIKENHGTHGALERAFRNKCSLSVKHALISEFGADINAKSCYGRTLFCYFATSRQHEDDIVEDLFLMPPIKIEDYDVEDLEVGKKCVERSKLDPNIICSGSTADECPKKMVGTALHIIIASKYITKLKTLDLLIKYRRKLNIEDSGSLEEHTPYCCDLDIEDPEGNTALAHSIKYYNYDAMVKLINVGVKLRVNSQSTPFHLIIESFKNGFSFEWMHRYREHGYEDYINALIDSGLDINVLDDKGQNLTFVFISEIIKNHKDSFIFDLDSKLDFLRLRDVKLNIVNNEGETFLDHVDKEKVCRFFQPRFKKLIIEVLRDYGFKTAQEVLPLGG